MARGGRELVAVVLAVALAGCRSCSRRECEPDTLPAHCEGQELVFCAVEGTAYGHDLGTRRARVACLASDTCIDDHQGHAACVHAPATPCTPEGFHGTCDGRTPLVCMPPSASIEAPYVVSGSACVGDLVCRATPEGALCVRDGTPCPLPEGRVSACVGGELVVCGPGKTGRVEVLRARCACREISGPDGGTTAVCDK